MLLALLIVLKLLLVAVLCRIGFLDFSKQKIRNVDVLVVLGLGGATMAIGWIAGIGLWQVGLGVAAALLFFFLLVPFWLLGKVGAGDVKFLAVSPIAIGGGDLFLFSLALLVAAVLTAFIVKNPVLLPEGLFRRYIEFLDRKQVVPFGVPISAGLIFVLLLQIVRAGSALV